MAMPFTGTSGKLPEMSVKVTASVEWKTCPVPKPLTVTKTSVGLSGRTTILVMDACTVNGVDVQTALAPAVAFFVSENMASFEPA